ncbi:hypothetical protein MMC21_002054 [Puttea exsequens]|nr:hypothetical protein [Puttea exsequens]
MYQQNPPQESMRTIRGPWPIYCNPFDGHPRYPREPPAPPSSPKLSPSTTYDRTSHLLQSNRNLYPIDQETLHQSLACHSASPAPCSQKPWSHDEPTNRQTPLQAEFFPKDSIQDHSSDSNHSHLLTCSDAPDNSSSTSSPAASDFSDRRRFTFPFHASKDRKPSTHRTSRRLAQDSANGGASMGYGGKGEDGGSIWYESSSDEELEDGEKEKGEEGRLNKTWRSFGFRGR